MIFDYISIYLMIYPYILLYLNMLHYICIYVYRIILVLSTVSMIDQTLDPAIQSTDVSWIIGKIHYVVHLNGRTVLL